MSTTVTLTDAQLENVRRELMKSAASSLRTAADNLSRLADVAPWPEENLTTDVIGSVRIAECDLASIDALGWPPNSRGDDD